MFNQVPISELINASQLTGSEFVPLVQDGETRKTTSVQFKTTDAGDLVTGTVNKARLPIATTSNVGVVKAGSGTLVDESGSLSIPIATTSARGSVIIGDGITVNGSGVISAERATCPFKMTLEENGTKVRMASGTIGSPPVLPNGMNPSTGLVNDWIVGWVLFKCFFVANDVTISSIDILFGQESLPSNTTTNSYYVAGYLEEIDSVKTITNSCVKPSPSVCDLQFT